MRFTRREAAPAPRGMSRARVLFTTSEREIERLDVATGPCVPLPTRKRPLVSVHQQWSDTSRQFAALYQALGGPAGQEWRELSTVGDAVLVCVSDGFTDALAALSHRAIALRDSEGMLDEVDEVAVRWLALGDWPADQLARGLSSRLLADMGLARRAREKSQALYCWFGPRVPEYVIATGTFDELPAYLAAKQGR